MSSPEKIALTYANDQLMDGAGAQFQRVYGIYAIARHLKIPYVHSPLTRISNHGLMALENNARKADIESIYNKAFSLPSDITVPENPTIHNVKDVTLDFIEEVRARARSDHEFHLIRILFPYIITDENPELYRCLKAVSPFHKEKSDVFKIAIHIRRGDLFVLETERMLPNSYYVHCVMKLVVALNKLNINFVCELHTEVPSKTFTVSPGHHGIDNHISTDVVVDPKMNSIEDYDVIPNLVKKINIDPIESMASMATADALILSRSSFSYVPALLNPECIVVYHPFRHQPLKEWLVSDAKGNFSEVELLKQLNAWKAARKKGFWSALARRFRPVIASKKT